MAKMSFIPDLRYSMDQDKSLETAISLHEDISMMQLKPYPQEHEIGLPRNNFFYTKSIFTDYLFLCLRSSHSFYILIDLKP